MCGRGGAAGNLPANEVNGKIDYGSSIILWKPKTDRIIWRYPGSQIPVKQEKRSSRGRANIKKLLIFCRFQSFELRFRINLIPIQNSIFVRQTGRIKIPADQKPWIFVNSDLYKRHLAKNGKAKDMITICWTVDYHSIDDYFFLAWGNENHLNCYDYDFDSR